MKKSAFLINTARGAIIEEEALIRALKEGTIAGAGLDVFANEPAVPAALAKLDNVVLLPHIGSATRETREAMAAMALKSAINVLSGVLPSTAVNGDIWPFLLQRLGPLRSR